MVVSTLTTFVLFEVSSKMFSLDGTGFALQEP